MAETTTGGGGRRGRRGRRAGMAVPGWIDLLGRMVERAPGFWRRLGDLETRLLADELAGVAVERPVYVAGLARAGTTVLLELLAGLPGVATHRYRDFPPGAYAPVLWDRAFSRVYRGGAAPAERAHQDRILVTPDSPEALEEVLWQHFLPWLHAPGGGSRVLGPGASNPAFERFYRDHLRKVLLVRGGTRYLAKGNYNLTRLGYLRKLFPDARFLVPVRDPLWHVASLMKQHALFAAAEARDPRVLAHMRRAGHTEFGLGRRAVDVGDGAAAEVEALWAAGEEARGWARYWNSLYRLVAAQRAADPAGLGEAAMVVRYEDLCARPRATLEAALAHARLDPPPPAELDAMAARLAAPAYYAPASPTRSAPPSARRPARPGPRRATATPDRRRRPPRRDPGRRPRAARPAAAGPTWRSVTNATRGRAPSLGSARHSARASSTPARPG
jgi:hypothetical protein